MPAPPVPVPNSLIVTNAGIPVPVIVCPTANTPVTVPATVNTLPDTVDSVPVAVVATGTGSLLFNRLKLRISVIGNCARIELALVR